MTRDREMMILQNQQAIMEFLRESNGETKHNLDERIKWTKRRLSVLQDDKYRVEGKK